MYFLKFKFLAVFYISVLILFLVLTPKKAMALNFVTKGELSSTQSVLFIHGTPGNAKVYKKYYEDKDFLKRFFMVSVDRLGFGKSSKQAEVSLDVQVDSILKLLRGTWPSKKFSCIGHSYGVPICLMLFLKDPNRFTKGVLLAGVSNPNRKLLRWYNFMADRFLVKIFLSKGFKNSNKEMKSLRPQLKNLESHLREIDKEILILHGKKDGIVPFTDSEFLVKNLIQSKVKVFLPEKMGHLFIWKKSDFVKTKVLEFLNAL